MNAKKDFDTIIKQYFLTNSLSGEYSYFRKASSSWKLTDWCLRYSGIEDPKTKLVAASIASYYNTKTNYAYPSYETIGLKLGISRSTFARSIKNMKLSGEWLVYPIDNSYGKTSNRYIPIAPLLSNVANDNIKILRLNKAILEESNDKAYEHNLSTVYKANLDRIWRYDNIKQLGKVDFNGLKEKNTFHVDYLIYNFLKEIEMLHNIELKTKNKYQKNNIINSHILTLKEVINTKNEEVINTEKTNKSLFEKYIENIKKEEYCTKLLKADIQDNEKNMLKHYNLWVSHLRQNSIKSTNSALKDMLS